VRWFGDGSEAEHFTVVEGVPRPDPGVQLDVSFARPQDGNPDATRPGRPEVGFLFGLRDVDVDPVKDPKTNADVLARPVRGWQLLIRADGVKLLEVRDTQRKVLEERAANLKSCDKLGVAVEPDGGGLTAQVNGQSFTFKAPADRSGFYGLSFHGAGYAAVQKLQITGKR